MEYYSNNDRMLQAVLRNEQLVKFGKYDPDEIRSMDEALCSENYVINVVAQIIKRTSEDASDRVIWKEINDYLRRSV
jgi:hypothetical protein